MLQTAIFIKWCENKTFLKIELILFQGKTTTKRIDSGNKIKMLRRCLNVNSNMTSFMIYIEKISTYYGLHMRIIP